MNENKKEDKQEEEGVPGTPYSLDETSLPEEESEESGVKKHSLVAAALILLVLALIFLVKVLSGGGAEPVTDPVVVVPEVKMEYVKVQSHDVIGDYLTDTTSGLTLYKVNQEKCPIQCMKQWIPYLGADEINTSEVTSEYIESESKYHYAWKGNKLYYYAVDSLPGDTLGEGFYFVGKIARP